MKQQLMNLQGLVWSDQIFKRHQENREKGKDELLVNYIYTKKSWVFETGE